MTRWTPESQARKKGANCTDSAVADQPRADLALTLLVAKVRADHSNHTVATHNLAVAADFLDGRTDFHGNLKRRNDSV
jgi:hypothetical protein